MRLVVSDTNIWIDLLKAGLTDHFFRLPLEIHTSALVLEELTSPQRDQLEPYISNGQLFVRKADYDFIELCQPIKQSNASLSLPDVSVYVYASEINGMVLTGDRLLLKYIKEQGIETHGILWLFDEWLDKEILTSLNAKAYLETLMKINNRLPLEECKKRLSVWT